MTRPPSSAVLAATVGLLFLVLVVGALMRMPEAGPVRVVYVNVGQ